MNSLEDHLPFTFCQVCRQVGLSLCCLPRADARGTPSHEGTINTTMLTNTLKKRLALCVAAASALTVAGTFAPGAQADPQQLSAAVGVGSDTTQDVLNALAGFNAGRLYNPVQATAANGYRQLISFDAVGSNCITTKLLGPSFDRPNGSGEGVQALSRTVDGGVWKRFVPNCGNLGNDISSQVDFARSSSGPSAAGAAGTTGTGTPLTYIPYARDALSFAFYRPAGSPATTATRAELNAVFQWNGVGTPPTIGGVPSLPCGIQNGSGTYRSWRGFVSTPPGGNSTSATAAEATATTLCNSLVNPTLLGGRAQENDATALKARGDAMVLTPARSTWQVVIGFSAANWIAQLNGTQVTTIPAWGANGGIGSISESVLSCNLATNCLNLGNPVAGVPGNYVPATTFFLGGPTTSTPPVNLPSPFSRVMYNVVDTAFLSISPDLQDLFVGPTSAVCNANATINALGFASLPSGATNNAANCGSLATLGALLLNPTS